MMMDLLRHPRGIVGPVRRASVRRGPLRQAVAALGVLLLLTTSASQAFGLHQCPHHEEHHRFAGDVGAGEEGSHADSHHGPAGHHSSAAADDSYPPVHAVEGADSRRPDAEPCKHINVCQAPSSVAIPPAADAASVWSFAPEPLPHFVAPRPVLPGTPPFFMPLSQAPPTS